MADFAKGKIQCFRELTELGAPDDLERVIIDFIAGARKSLNIAVQELDSEPVAQAILDARWRGVKVRMVLEQDYLASPRPPGMPANSSLKLPHRGQRLQAQLLHSLRPQPPPSTLRRTTAPVTRASATSWSPPNSGCHGRTGALQAKFRRGRA